MNTEWSFSLTYALLLAAVRLVFFLPMFLCILVDHPRDSLGPILGNQSIFIVALKLDGVLDVAEGRSCSDAHRAAGARESECTLVCPRSRTHPGGASCTHRPSGYQRTSWCSGGGYSTAPLSSNRSDQTPAAWQPAVRPAGPGERFGQGSAERGRERACQ